MCKATSIPQIVTTANAAVANVTILNICIT